MTICPWCAQESQSNAVCDWCKRPLDKAQGPPASTRSDLDFLREESDVNRFGAVKAAAIVVGAIAIGALMFLLFKPQNEPVAEAPPPKLNAVKGRDGQPAKVKSADGTVMVVLPPRKPVFWIQNFDTSSDLISNFRWTQQSPRTVKSATLSMARYESSSVRLQDVDLTMVNLPKGVKRAVGRAVVVNSTNRNVLFYRFQLIWGAKEYLMIPLEGDSAKLQPVYAREMRPGAKAAVQIISPKITDYPDGTPTSVRLWAWLDGSPDSSVDDFQIQLGR